MHIEEIKDRIHRRMNDLWNNDNFQGNSEYETLDWILDMLDCLQETE